MKYDYMTTELVRLANEIYKPKKERRIDKIRYAYEAYIQVLETGKRVADYNVSVMERIGKLLHTRI